ncbi:MAG: class I SAM-dependent methyltransferase [Planctomycetota bacterium]|jgi:ubiquinone/menaquinone biosynthesis C-methylase UbiE
MTVKETYWSKFAADFEERTNYVVGNDHIELMKAVLSKQTDLGNTLELGCGAGTYSEILAREAHHLTATDYSDEMVAVSTQRFESFENVTVEKANCFSLTYPEFMANLLHVIPEPEKAVEECKKVLTRDGRLIIVSFTTEGMTVFSKLGMIFRYLKTFGKPPPTAHKLTVQKTKTMLSDCGFKVDEARLIGHRSKAVFANAVVS